MILVGRRGELHARQNPGAMSESPQWREPPSFGQRAMIPGSRPTSYEINRTDLWQADAMRSNPDTSSSRHNNKADRVKKADAPEASATKKDEK